MEIGGLMLFSCDAGLWADRDLRGILCGAASAGQQRHCGPPDGRCVMNPVFAASRPCVLRLYLWSREGVIPCYQGRP